MLASKQIKGRHCLAKKLSEDNGMKTLPSEITKGVQAKTQISCWLNVGT
jgi:hypothetical protein